MSLYFWPVKQVVFNCQLPGLPDRRVEGFLGDKSDIAGSRDEIDWNMSVDSICNEKVKFLVYIWVNTAMQPSTVSKGLVYLIASKVALKVAS